MVDMDWKSKTVKSPRPSKKLNISLPLPIRTCELSTSSDSLCSAYEQYLRLPELKKLWSSSEFPNWKNESIIKPALQALEITIRFVSTVLSDPRLYTNSNQWIHRLESLIRTQLEIIAVLCEEDESKSAAPILDLMSRGSEQGLLPQLATWKKSENVAKKIMYSIECGMRNSPYTLGLGEPNLLRKPILNYDLICKPLEVHLIKKSYNFENQTLYTTHQLLESWIYVSQNLLQRIRDEIDLQEFNKASNDSWLLEKICKVLTEIEDLHLLTDPDDFLRLKSELSLKANSESELFCFRSRSLVEITKQSKDLRHKVPVILKVEVDPTGGPRIQEAAMRLYRKRDDFGRIHLLQALHAIESAMKRFYFSYKQVVAVCMGSLEGKGKWPLVKGDSNDALAQIFLEPTYFPSIDAAKTFLGEYWSHNHKHSFGSDGK